MLYSCLTFPIATRSLSRGEDWSMTMTITMEIFENRYCLIVVSKINVTCLTDEIYSGSNFRQIRPTLTFCKPIFYLSLVISRKPCC